MLNKSAYRILFLDIETSPDLGWVWGKWQQNVIAFEASWHLLSFSAKWAGDRRPKTWGLPDFPLYQKDPSNDRDLAKKLWDLLNEADLVIAHNGDRFDIRKANARFILHGLTPPVPYQTIDTLKLARKYFKFTSNSLNDLAKYLGIGKKVHTGGFELWLGCMRGDASAWRRMKKYNAQDVVLLEAIYERFRGWHTTHPNINVKDNPHSAKCPACGSDRVRSRGTANRKVFRVRRFRCSDCGKWSYGQREKIPGVLLA